MTTVLRSLRLWAETVKLAHSVFALPFALMATFLAGRNIEGRGMPHWGQIGLILICMLSARSVAMTFNRIADTQIDARNPRTAARPLPSARLTLAAAWIMLGLSAVTFGAGCLGFFLLYGNTWPMLLSGPVLLFLCGYSFTKRFTKWSHYYLGTALALSPAAAWLAIHPASIDITVLWIMGAVCGWVAGFDIIYACQDIESDRREGLFSLPSRIGPRTALWVARASHAMSLICLVMVGLTAQLGALYAVGVGAAAVLLVVENALVRPNDFRRVNLAFFTINGIVSVVVGILAIADILIPIPLTPS
jgi:4-hydroxybenzoate polyprenyltransferase